MYQATSWNIQRESDLDLVGWNLTIDVLLLFVICSRDAVCVPGMMQEAKDNGLVPLLKEVTIDSAHWSPLEAPEHIAEHVKTFVSRFTRKQTHNIDQNKESSDSIKDIDSVFL